MMKVYWNNFDNKLPTHMTSLFSFDDNVPWRIIKQSNRKVPISSPPVYPNTIHLRMGIDDTSSTIKMVEVDDTNEDEDVKYC